MDAFKEGLRVRNVGLFLLGVSSKGLGMNGREDDRIVSANEAAQILLLRSRRSLDRMRRQGRGPRFYRMGEGPRPRVRYRVSDLMSYLRPSDARPCN